MDTGCSQNYANWKGHALLGRIAFDTLPAWEQALIKPDMSTSAMTQPYIPEYVKSVADKTGFMCSILDLIYYKDCRPFATLPDGRWIPHSPPDSNMQSSCSSGHPRSPVATIELITWLMTRMIDAIRENEWEEAIRFGGALGHFLQEPFTPGHAVDNQLFHEFFPDPNPQRHIRLHHAFDSASAFFEPKPPVLMGSTTAEAAYRLYLEIERGIREGKKLISTLIQTVYDGHTDLVRQAILANQCKSAVFVTASAWHTAISIAQDQFSDTELQNLDCLDLTEVTPYFVHHWYYTDLLPGHLVQNGLKIPIHVWEKSPTGDLAEKLVHKGFGMGGHMAFKFFIDGGTYPWLSLQVGLPSRQKQGQDEHTSTTFYIDIDPDYNEVYSEDIEYGAQTVFALRLKPGQAVQDVLVDVSKARSLIIRAQTDPYEDEDGKINFSIPHIAVCNPLLSKNKSTR